MLTALLVIFGIALAIYLTAGLLFLGGLFLPAVKKKSERPFVSVIIAARNEENNIRRCLQSVIRQTYPADLFEIIVVNDRSSDQTAAITGEFMTANTIVKMITITETPAGYSPKKWALQNGIESSRGDILLFTDADCEVRPEWIETMAEYFDDKTGMVIGFSSVQSRTLFHQLQAMDFLALMTCASGVCNLGFPLSASGQNLAYRRKGFDEAGGFRSVMTRISGDDVLMVQLFRKKTKWKTVFAADPLSYATTQPAENLGQLIRQRARWASNATIMLKLNPSFLLYLTGVYIFHLGLAGLLLASLWNPFLITVAVFAWMNKLIVDLMVILNGSRIFRRPFSLFVFLIWFILQTPYVLWVGFRGPFGLFQWK